MMEPLVPGQVGFPPFPLARIAYREPKDEEADKKAEERAKSPTAHLMKKLIPDYELLCAESGGIYLGYILGGEKEVFYALIIKPQMGFGLSSPNFFKPVQLGREKCVTISDWDALEKLEGGQWAVLEGLYRYEVTEEKLKKVQASNEQAPP